MHLQLNCPCFASSQRTVENLLQVDLQEYTEYGKKCWLPLPKGEILLTLVAHWAEARYPLAELTGVHVTVASADLQPTKSGSTEPYVTLELAGQRVRTKPKVWTVPTAAHRGGVL